MPVGLYQSPKTRDKYTKLFSVSRTDTVSNVKAVLPKGSVILSVNVIGSLNSNAASTATINVGSTSGGNDIITAYDVKTGATGQRVAAGAAGSAFATILPNDTQLWCTYAETGTASTQGGPWLFNLEYVVLGPNEAVTD